MGQARYKRFLCVIDNRQGCMVISFVELLWYGLNLILCANALEVGLNDYVMRITYYRKDEFDQLAMIYATIGVGGSILSLAGSAALFLVAFMNGRMKLLLLAYLAKNAATIGVELGLSIWAVLMEKSSLLVRLLFSGFSIVFLMYFGFIAKVYQSEIKQREIVAERLYVAYDILIGGDAPKPEGEVDPLVKKALAKKIQEATEPKKKPEKGAEEKK